MVNVPNTAVLSGAFCPMRFEATVEDCLGFTPHGHWMDFR
jgi:hypothetical protein